MATRGQNITASADQAAALIASLDADLAGGQVKMSYTAPNGQSFGWNEYRAALVAELKGFIDGARGSSSLEQQANGPFTILG